MSNNQPLNSSLKKKESKINSNSYNKQEENNEKEIPLRYNNGNEKESNNLNETKNILAQTQEKRLSLNVEDLLIQEDKLYKILDNIRIKVNFNFSAEEYLEFSHITSIQTFEIFFSDEKFIFQINCAQIYEFLSAILATFLYLKNYLNERTINHLKNILYYTHQNLIMIINLLTKKINIEYQDNIWVKKLKECVKTKRSESLTGDEKFIIEQNNNILFNSIGNFILLYFNNKEDFRIFAIINDIMCNLEKCSLDNVKNNLFNLKNMLIYSSENSQESFVHVNLQGPFLPKIDSKYKYTLVLDLDETIIHCLDQQEIVPLIRPGTKEFLSELSKYYEIVIFTASIKDYADTILNLIDKDKKWIRHRLYRKHTTVLKNTYLKDLSKLGRDLNKVIIIDNAYDNFKLQSDNGIFINTWIDDKKDTALFDLIPILREIVVKKVKDVRKALRKVRDTMMRLYVKGDNNPYNTVIQYIKDGEKI
jgi:CTD small phosphatase-like protein 2